MKLVLRGSAQHMHDLGSRARHGAHKRMLTMHDAEGSTEKLETAAPTSDLQWTAFLRECDYEVDTMTLERVPSIVKSFSAEMSRGTDCASGFLKSESGIVGLVCNWKKERTWAVREKNFGRRVAPPPPSAQISIERMYIGNAVARAVNSRRQLP
ncbi:hypothetical protein DFH06DRAFT_1129338 [Mycena polygramma]|nr:hypothetical protein DFH06DRAFT_1129338 [Mycena polygramma]